VNYQDPQQLRLFRLTPAPEPTEEVPLPAGLRWMNLDPATLADDLRFRLWEVSNLRADLARDHQRQPTPGMREALFKALNLEQRTMIALEAAKRHAALGWSTDKHADSIGLSLNQILRLYDETAPKP